MHTLFSTHNDTVQSIIARLTNDDPTFKVVKCGQLNLNSASSEEIFKALKKNTHVIKLEFVGNKSKDAIECLADSIRTHQSLEAIHLGDNGLNDEAVRYLFESLSENLSSVQTVDINCNEDVTDLCVPLITKIIEKSSNIRQLDISFTGITDVGLQEIAVSLEKNPNSSLLELCEPEILQRGYLTQNGELAQRFSDYFSKKQAGARLNL